MSGKSKLKTDILREKPFVDALCLNEDPRALAPAGEKNLAYVIEDASVRMAAGPASGALGEDFLRSFQLPIERAFAEHPSLHTYILLFDKKKYVPPQKARTQGERADSMRSTSERTRVAPWEWDRVSSVLTLDGPMPPWLRVRADRDAYGRALDDLVAMMCTFFRAPRPGSRIIIDYASSEGDVLPIVLEYLQAPRREPYLVNTCGEADMAAQWYVSQTRFTGLSFEEHPPLMPGPTVLVSTDTDYFPLSILHFRDSLYPLWLAIGTCHVLPTKEFCSRTAEGAAPRAEIWDIGRLVQIIKTVPCLRRAAGRISGGEVASFVIFCCVTGNDYVERLPGVTHGAAWEAFQEEPIRPLLDEGVWLADASSYARFVKTCHWRRLEKSGKRAATLADGGLSRSSSWPALSAALTKAFSATAPSEEFLHAAFAELSWALAYASVGPAGHSRIPE